MDSAKGKETSKTESPRIAFRGDVFPKDAAEVRRIVEATGFFHPPEVDVAVELVEERLAKGEKSGYFFVFAEAEGKTCAYACYGPIACTVASYDLFWIAVEPGRQGGGLGRRVLEECERRIREMGGRQVYIETSNRPQYEPTRAFYDRCAYRRAAVLEDFYAPGDDKVIFVKTL